MKSGSTSYGRSATTTKSTQDPGIHAGQLVYQLVDLRDHDPVAESGGLDDRRGVLGVRTCIEVALGVGRLGGHQRDGRHEVDEEAGVELEVGVDRTDAQLAIGQSCATRRL